MVCVVCAVCGVFVVCGICGKCMYGVIYGVHMYVSYGVCVVCCWGYDVFVVCGCGV